MEPQSYHEKLKNLMDEYVHFVYQVTKTFPKEERYGVTSQFRRSALSVILNYIEGFARFRKKVNKNFLETSFGSLKESEYLFKFAFDEGYLSEKDLLKGKRLAGEIGAMLWGILRQI